MSKGKGKEVATKPDWKEQLAMLDQDLGWDEQAGSDWADSCEAEEQEVLTPNLSLQIEHNHRIKANISQSTEKNHGAYSQAEQDVSPGNAMTNWDYTCSYDTQQQFGNGNNYAPYELSDFIADEEIMSADMQKTLWEAAVDQARSAACVDTSTDALYDDDEEEEEIHTAPNQSQEEECFYEDQEEEEEEHFQPKSKFGTYLCNPTEEKNKSKREYFAQAGGSCLIKDPCILLPYPQADMPGTENVDKPVLTVTTPEGETLYPHDMEEYPEPLPASWHGPVIGWGGGPYQGEEHVVPYEDEDGADI